MSLAPKPDQELAQTFYQWALHGAKPDEMAQLAYASAISKLNLRPSNLALSRLRELNELAARKTTNTLDQLDKSSKFRHYLCFCAFFEALVEAQKLKQKLSVISLNPAAVNLRRCAVFKIGDSRFMPVAQWITAWPPGELDLLSNPSRAQPSEIYLPSKQFEALQVKRAKSTSEIDKQQRVAEIDEPKSSVIETDIATPMPTASTPVDPPKLKSDPISQDKPKTGDEKKPIIKNPEVPALSAQPQLKDSAISAKPVLTTQSIDPVAPPESASPLDSVKTQDSVESRISYSDTRAQRFILEPRPYLLAAALPALFLVLQLKQIWILWQSEFQSDHLVATLVWGVIWLLICLSIAGVYLTSKIEVFANKVARQSWFGSSQAFFDTETHFVHTQELTTLGTIKQTSVRTRHDYILLRAAKPQALISALNQLEETQFVPIALEQINSAQTLSFGAFTLTCEQLSYGNQHTPIDSIASFDYDLEWVEVKLKNANLFARVPAAAIDSAYRLKLLIQALSIKDAI